MALAVALLGCSDDDDAAPAPATTSTTAPTTCEAPVPELIRPDFDVTVQVFLMCGDVDFPLDLVPVARVVPDDGAPLRAAVNQLLLGVTPAEHDAGLRSAFTAFTASQLRGATITGGIATLDFTSGFESTNNFSTTNLSSIVYSQLDATVFQFETVTGLELAIEGERWCGWENTCDDEPVPLRTRP